jgi:hypothetical protein
LEGFDLEGVEYQVQQAGAHKRIAMYKLAELFRPVKTSAHHISKVALNKHLQPQSIFADGCSGKIKTPRLRLQVVYTFGGHNLD